MANAFLIVAPGRIPERRIQQIIASCEQAPEWPEISRIRATDEHVLNQRIYLWDPGTQRYEDRIITAYTFKYPHGPTTSSSCRKRCHRTDPCRSDQGRHRFP
ncbi:hypothetical protein [Nocardia asiatica]|uniref:hypothetical protein n=1 Tax=Nocardia asiatica TaxID=209252 RepID=UPI003EE3396C